MAFGFIQALALVLFMVVGVVCESDESHERVEALPSGATCSTDESCAAEAKKQLRHHALVQVRNRLHLTVMGPETDDPGAGEADLTAYEQDYLTDANNPLDRLYGPVIAGTATADPSAIMQADFDCKAGYANWNRGWSVEKKEWCCRVQQMGCADGTARGSAGDKKGAASESGSGKKRAASDGGKDGETVDSSSESGESSSAGKSNKGSSKSSEESSSENRRSGHAGERGPAGRNTSGSAGDSGNKTDSSVDNASAIADPAEACVTREDPRASSVGYTTSPPGTQCVFGVDDRDEGSHCIPDDGYYGSFGWCWTSEAMDSWGSCGESCPLFGQAKILGKAIDDLSAQLEDALKTSTSTTTTTTTNTTTMPELNLTTNVSNTTMPADNLTKKSAPAGGKKTSPKKASGQHKGPGGKEDSEATGSQPSASTGNGTGTGNQTDSQAGASTGNNTGNSHQAGF